MCGLVAIYDPDGRLLGPAGDAVDVIRPMTDVLRHRGPDQGGEWSDQAAGIALGHRRLSIIDLSETGRQPMTSADGRFVIAYNGEVYNFSDLRADLEASGVRFRGTSDTEVVLEACARWGVGPAVSRFIGMFAFALWDRETRKLFLVRDRLGIKPLYWGRVGGAVVAASELKSIAAAPGWRPEIDHEALTAFMHYGYVPAPRSIYRGIVKVVPGTIVTVDAAGHAGNETYWDPLAIAQQGLSDPLTAPLEDLADELETLLRDAVRRRLVADVPLGAFLSGGIDSSTVVAMMQAESSRPARTFTIGFEEEGFDESRHGREIAAHLGTDHTELHASPAHALQIVPRLPEMYDEPFADASQIPTFLVSELTRRHVTVALSGDGGDELFAGYNRYLWFDRLWNAARRIPPGGRRFLANSVAVVSAQGWDRVGSILPAGRRPRQFGDKVLKAAAALCENDRLGVYRRLLAQGNAPEKLLRAPEFSGERPGRLPPETDDFIAQMQFLDLVGYLPDDILTKVDRASMAVSLEARVPLIDHRVVEFAWRLPMSAKIDGHRGKHLLRQVLYRHVPPALVERPKAGFSVPLESWLAGPLRDWAESLLGADDLRAQGLFDEAAVRTLWQDFLSHGRASPHLVWNVLMFQAWHRRWVG